MNLVTTTLGELPESDLRYETKEVENNGNVVVMAREWFYKGSDPQHVGELVRRDVWATIKCGQAAQAASEL